MLNKHHFISYTESVHSTSCIFYVTHETDLSEIFLLLMLGTCIIHFSILKVQNVQLLPSKSGHASVPGEKFETWGFFKLTHKCREN